ncbi:hypothetical protein PRIPAC_82913 [Pristionchus pacificus]|uniref:G protein-coupled receptor n=1 Tax=Pristionchus pacificus TaxID=54126 RepID=A0A2A6CKI0_PRIPA|nr:hypothetical protein PRIPAC_82913 [Pristionchus pacificus]|eukprot:PDM78616.1 G protein-coupled receptor [Pristionchus pacificus]
MHLFGKFLRRQRIRLHPCNYFILTPHPIFLNFVVYALVRFSKKIDGFRYVFYTYCVTNTVFAFNYALILTQWVQLPGASVFFPTGPFAEDLTITPIAFRSESFIYFFIMCLVAATFMYRYFMVVRHKLNVEYGERFPANFGKIYILVIATRTTDLNVIGIISGVLIAVQLISMIWTGWRIYITIHASIGSQKLKILEKNAFRLLISQAVNPMVLIFVPTFINFYQAEMMKLPEIVNQIATILMNSFVVKNPMLNIIFSSDNGFVLLHAIIAYLILFVAIILNIVVFVLVKVSTKIDGFRYVFYTYCVTNSVFALNYALLLTQWIHLSDISVFFPTGPFADNLTLIPAAFRVIFVAFCNLQKLYIQCQIFIYFFIMCLVAATYIYRYFAVTRPRANKFIMRAAEAFSFAPVILWLFDTFPTVELRHL